MLAHTPRRPVYGIGGPLPFHATLEDPHADLDSGLLPRLHASLLRLSDGQILRVSSPAPDLEAQLRSFERGASHALLTVVDDPRRPGWRDHYVRKGSARTSWRPDPEADATPIARAADRFAVDALMPTRLWLYTNYDCNLACDYCCVVAGPRADPRRLPAERIHDLVDQAAAAGFERIFVTGGEPLLRPDLPALLAYATDRLPVTLLTNAALVRGTRWAAIAPLVERGRPITFQVSLDSASPALHDAHRGPGAHARALAGIRTLLDAGARVRIAATLARERLDEIPVLDRLADELGVGPADRIFRPIALRGAATDGEPIRPEDVAPDLTADALGWSWHPLSIDPDMRLDVGADASLGEALAAVRERLDELVAARSTPLDRFVCG